MSLPVLCRAARGNSLSFPICVFPCFSSAFLVLSALSLCSAAPCIPVSTPVYVQLRCFCASLSHPCFSASALTNPLLALCQGSPLHAGAWHSPSGHIRFFSWQRYSSPVLFPGIISFPVLRRCCAFSSSPWQCCTYRCFAGSMPAHQCIATQFLFVAPRSRFGGISGPCSGSSPSAAGSLCRPRPPRAPPSGRAPAARSAA